MQRVLPPSRTLAVTGSGGSSSPPRRRPRLAPPSDSPPSSKQPSPSCPSGLAGRSPPRPQPGPAWQSQAARDFIRDATMGGKLHEKLRLAKIAAGAGSIGLRLRVAKDPGPRAASAATPRPAAAVPRSAPTVPGHARPDAFFRRASPACPAGFSPPPPLPPPPAPIAAAQPQLALVPAATPTAAPPRAEVPPGSTMTMAAIPIRRVPLDRMVM